MKAFRERLGYTFKNAALLDCALTHPSTLPPGLGRDFERLEFLGDRVLGLLIAEWLYEEFPETPEGELAQRFANLVRKETLVEIAHLLTLEKALRIRQERSAAQNKRLATLLADGCEALLGALYLDGGLEVVRQLVKQYWGPFLFNSPSPLQDPKSSLQEWAQSNGKSHPLYTVLSCSGPAHSPLFTVQVQIEDYLPLEGKGSSKQLAEKAAAQNMLETLGIAQKA